MVAGQEKSGYRIILHRIMSTDSNILSTKQRIKLKENDYYDKSDITVAVPRKYEIKYQNALLIAYVHLAGLYGLYLGATSAKRNTIIFNFILYFIGGYGITAGAHRLWAHRTYKAKPFFEFLTMLCNCVSYQQTVIKWVRDHRLHHKYSDTDADPHNANRGFFYSHIGWLLVKKSDLVLERGKTIDISDLENNRILQFQKKYAILLFSAGCFILPTVIPIILFGEELNTAWHVSLFRYVVNLNAALCVNSLAHIYGGRPYNKSILPTQNFFVTFLSGGEGYHNYHHAFPWDYRTAEIGNNYFNITTWLLDFFARLGWVYDLKSANPEMIEMKAKALGDGTNCWGYDW